MHGSGVVLADKSQTISTALARRVQCRLRLKIVICQVPPALSIYLTRIQGMHDSTCLCHVNHDCKRKDGFSDVRTCS